MTTEKFSLSLRLRHGEQALSAVAQQLHLPAGAGWDVGDNNTMLDGRPRAGVRRDSYRSYELAEERECDLDDVLWAALRRLEPYNDIFRSLIESGGKASLVVGWFCDSAVGGDSVSSRTMARLAQLNLSLDLHLYMTPAVATNIDAAAKTRPSADSAETDAKGT